MRTHTIKPQEVLDAEKIASDLLNTWCKAKKGRAARLSRATGIFPPHVTKMCTGQPISMSSAMLIEIATGGELKAEVLCPAKADLIAQFRAGKYFGNDVTAVSQAA